MPVAVLLGIAIGLIVSLTASTSRRAEAAVLISSPRGPAAVTPYLPNLRELATSGVLAGNVHSTLRLKESVENVRGHFHASVRPSSQVIVIAATDGNADKARQLAQEGATVFTRLVADRFGSRTPPLQAALFDAAHTLPAPNRHFLRNALMGAAAGLILGALAAFRLGRGVEASRPWPAPAGDAGPDLGERESLLEQRVRALAGRERELAKHAGKLAAREREIESREGDVAKQAEQATARQRDLETREREFAKGADQTAARSRALEKQQRKFEEQERELEKRKQELEARPAPAPEPEPTPEPVSAVALPGRPGAWNLNDLEHAVEARTDVTAEQADEWRSYLFFLREHASSDGSLPSQLDGLVEDVFGDVSR